eukprot:gene9315-6653_t
MRLPFAAAAAVVAAGGRAHGLHKVPLGPDSVINVYGGA